MALAHTPFRRQGAVQGQGVLSLLSRNVLIIQFNETRQMGNHNQSIVWMLGALVLAQPKDAEVGNFSQEADLAEVGYAVLAKIQLSQLIALAKVTQRVDFVDAQRKHFQVGKLVAHTHVGEFIAPGDLHINIIGIAFDVVSVIHYI